VLVVVQHGSARDLYNASGTLVASVPGTSITLTGLTIGTSYTYDVVGIPRSLAMVARLSQPMFTILGPEPARTTRRLR
jgi:hypothetical protein